MRPSRSRDFHPPPLCFFFFSFLFPLFFCSRKLRCSLHFVIFFLQEIIQVQIR